MQKTILALLLLVMLAGCVALPPAVLPESRALTGGTSNFTGDVTVSGTVTGADLVATDSLSVSGAVVGATWFGLTAQTALVIGAGDSVVSTGSLQPITSATAVTVSTTVPIAAGTVEGYLLILVNENAADAITIDGTGGTVECKADVVLGARDVLMLEWNGTEWICLTGYDNS